MGHLSSAWIGAMSAMESGVQDAINKVSDKGKVCQNPEVEASSHSSVTEQYNAARPGNVTPTELTNDQGTLYEQKVILECDQAGIEEIQDFFGKDTIVIDQIKKNRYSVYLITDIDREFIAWLIESGHIKVIGPQAVYEYACKTFNEIF